MQIPIYIGQIAYTLLTDLLIKCKMHVIGSKLLILHILRRLVIGIFNTKAKNGFEFYLKLISSYTSPDFGFNSILCKH